MVSTNPTTGFSAHQLQLLTSFEMQQITGGEAAVMLRRLANPHLPPQSAYNPYVTIDYLESPVPRSTN